MPLTWKRCVMTAVAAILLNAYAAMGAKAEDAASILQIELAPDSTTSMQPQSEADEAQVTQPPVAGVTDVTGLAGVTSVKNSAAKTQHGSDNTADILQEGSGNKAEIIQRGSDNYGAIHQSQSGHTAELQQFGNGLSLKIEQFGPSNPGSAPIVVKQAN